MPTPRRNILLATGNPAKFREIIAILDAAFADALAKPRWISLADLSNVPPEPHEDGATFAANARLKAAYYSTRTGHWAIADDSGLEVDALAGAPGVHSARYAGLVHTADRKTADAANNRKLIAALQSVPPERRTARFRCAVALADGPRILAEAEGRVEGRIIDPPRGHDGFGYDPHFLINDLGRTTAELPADEKNRVSHRGQAFRQLPTLIVDLLARDSSRR